MIDLKGNFGTLSGEHTSPRDPGNEMPESWGAKIFNASFHVSSLELNLVRDGLPDTLCGLSL